MSQSILGLDIGRRRVKAVRLETTFKGYEAVRYAEVELPAEALAAPPAGAPEPPADAPPAEAGEGALVAPDPSAAWLAGVGQAVERLIAEHDMACDVTVTAIPGDRVTTRVLTLPFRKEREIDLVLGPELEERLPMALDEVAFDYQVLSQDAEGSRLLVAVAGRRFIRDFLAVLQAAGVDPRIVTVTGFAKADLLQHMRVAEDGPLMVCDMGHQSTTLTVVRNGHPAMWRTSPRGAAAVQRSLEGVAQEDPQAVSAAIGRAIGPVLRDIKHTFLAAQGLTGEDVRAVYLCGGGSLLGGLDVYLEQRLEVDVVRLEPSRAPFNRLPDAERRDPVVCEALALALRALPGRTDEVNFRKGEFGFRGEYQYMRGRIYKLAVAAMALVVSLGGLAYSRHYALAFEERALIAQLKARTKVILGKEYADFDQAVMAVSRQGKGDKDPIPRRDGYALLHDVSVKVGEDVPVDLDLFEVDLDRERAEVRGRTGSPTDVQTLVERVRAVECVKSVETERNERGTDERQVFHLTMKLEGC